LTLVLRRLRLRYTRTGGASAELLATPWARMPAVATPEWRPACDVYETGAEWIVKAEIAGVDERDFVVLLYEDCVVVEGRRPWVAPATGADARVLAAEIRHGPFRLVVPLMPPVDRDAASGSYDRGLLVLRLPKGRAGG
jgi:HSP20 family molecular chaperone IbpA